MLLRLLAPLTLALALVACGQPAAPGGDASAPKSGPVTISAGEDLPDWLLVARQRDCAADAPTGEQCPLGEVFFNQRTITRNEDGTADIWVQVRHGAPQLYEVLEGATRTRIRFTIERLHYRFNCASSQFIVVERLILGPNEAVVARDSPHPIYRDPLRGSITIIVMPIACRGS